MKILRWHIITDKRYARLARLEAAADAKARKARAKRHSLTVPSGVNFVHNTSGELLVSIGPVTPTGINV